MLGFLRSLVVGGLLLLGPAVSQAQWFDNARNAIDINASQSDYGGASLRGGVHLHTGAAATTIMRGSASVGGGCQAFDFAASFREALEAIPDVIRTIATQFIMSLPMVITCNLEPILCDIAKHLQAFINFTLQARYAQCQSAQHAAMYLGLRLRGDQVSKCLEREQRRPGATLSGAMATCNDSPFDLIGPDGLPGREIQLIRDTLRVAGVDQETQTVASHLLGEITLQAGNPLAISTVRSAENVRGLYTSHQERFATALRTVADQYSTEGHVSNDALRAASTPEQPLPIAAVQALSTLKQDPAAYAASLGRLSTAQALSQLNTDCAELEAKLTAAMDGNGHLGAEERQGMERQLAALRRTIASIMQAVEIKQKHLDPAIDALMHRFTAMQETATAAGLRVPAVTVPQPRYRMQSPMGYSR